MSASARSLSIRIASRMASWSSPMVPNDPKMWQVKDMPERPIGLFDARYRAFLETVSDVRAQLHRYCARMTGSRLDGEDLMQETLFEAYTKIETLDDARRLKPWVVSHRSQSLH